MASTFRYGSRIPSAKPVVALNSGVPDFGGDFIDDTDTHTPDGFYGWCELIVLTATVVNANTKCNIANISGKTLPANTRIPGIFSQIDLTSGSVIAMRATG
jgi:hypothetical protein